MRQEVAGEDVRVKSQEDGRRRDNSNQFRTFLRWRSLRLATRYTLAV